MTDTRHKQLGDTLWKIADKLRGAMNADDFRDYMLSFLFLRYLSDHYENGAKKDLGKEYSEAEALLEKSLTNDASDERKVIEQLELALKERLQSEIQTLEQRKKDSNSELEKKAIDESIVLLKKKIESVKLLNPLSIWYAQNHDATAEFEEGIRRKLHYVVKPEFLWSNIHELARTQSSQLLETLQSGFRFIENESFNSAFKGLFSEVNLDSEKLGKNYEARNSMLCSVIIEIGKGLSEFCNEVDLLGNAYEILIGHFAAGSGKKAGEFYTPQQVSSILSKIVILDSHKPSTGNRPYINNLLDFTCGSGSLLIRVRDDLLPEQISQVYGQEKNITTYNLARMNMLLHGFKDSEFKIFHGDTLSSDWDILNEMNPAKKLECDAVVANPPFSYRWEPSQELSEDFRFKNYGVAPKSAADFAFLLHGFHYLSENGTMAIILPHGVLFRGGAEEKIRTKLLKDDNIDAIIGLPSNLFFSTSIPVCILVLKKCKKPDDVLFINASEHFEKGKRQNVLLPEHIDKIIDTYQHRKDDDKKYSRRVSMAEIEKNGYNLNISRYVSTASEEEVIDLSKVNVNLVKIESEIVEAKAKHNTFLRELGLPELP